MINYRLNHIDIEINHRCNLTCKHCSARPGKTNGNNELSSEEIKKTLSRGKELGLNKVGLTGGEPLFDIDKLSKIVAACVNGLDLPLHTHTNGTLVKEEYCKGDGVLTFFESISVTFLGGNAEIHDNMTRKKGSFDGAFRAAEIMANNRLPLTCYFIPTHGTCASFEKLMPRLKQIGVRCIRAMALAPSGRARPIYGETAPSSEEMSAFEQNLLKLTNELHMKLEAGYCTRLSMPGLAALNGHEECMSGINRVHINSKGDVFPCTAASGVKELKLGNLRENDFNLEIIWNDSPLINKIRMVHEGRLQSCRSCAVVPKCQFGCTVNTIGTMNGDIANVCSLVNQDIVSLE